MTLNDFRIGWRTLIKDPGYSLVVILGLGVGYAVFLLLLGFVRYSFTYNSSVPDLKDVFIIKQRYNIDAKAPWFDQVPMLARSAALKAPGVADVAGYAINDPVTVRADKVLVRLQLMTVTANFPSMMGLQAVQGDLKFALERPDSIVVTEAAALKLFGTANALDRTLQAGPKKVRIGAVLHDPPSNMTLQVEAMVGPNTTLLNDKARASLFSDSSAAWVKLFVRTNSGASIANITQAVQDAVDGSPAVRDYPPDMLARLQGRKVMDLKLSPLADAYFDSEVASNPITRPGDRGNAAAVMALAATAALILLLAAINYVNLSTVRVVQRRREIAMRKVMGAGAGQLALQFLAESLLVALLSTSLGLLLAWAALPLFAEMMGRQLDSIFSLANIAGALVIGAVLGGLTAIYPTWIAVRVRPNHVLEGRPGSESLRGRHLRRAMTVLQMAVAMGLVAFTSAIAWQTDYAIHASPGFDPALLLVIDLPVSAKNNEQVRGFMTALANQPAVAGVAIAGDAVGRSKSRFGMDVRREGKPSVFLEMKSVSANYFEQYRIKPVAGRLFDHSLDKEDDPEPLIVNLAALPALGFATAEEAVGQIVLYEEWKTKAIKPKRIVGVAPDLRYFSLREPARATGWELWTASRTLTVRAARSVAEAEAAVQAAWPSYFPDLILQMRGAHDILADNYANDERMAKILAVAAFIALAIAAFGIYALSAHAVQRRAKEIMLRKLHGAEPWDIVVLIGREIGGVTLVAALIGLPLAGVVVQKYLAGFMERAPVGYWTLGLAVLAGGAVALGAAGRHTWGAMRVRAVEGLRK